MSELADDTELVHLYVDEHHKDEWEEARLREGYPSLSRYLYELILEAQGYRRDGFLAHHDSENRIEELEEKVATLEAKLERERQRDAGRFKIDDSDFLKQLLTDEYQPLSEIMQSVVESEALDTAIRQRIESQLYFLATHDRVAYEPGHGWKLVDDTEA